MGFMDVENGILVFRVFRMMVQQRMRCGSHNGKVFWDMQMMDLHMMCITGLMAMARLTGIFQK